MAIIDKIKAFEDEYFNKLNLVASENLSSPDVRYALQSDFHHRYAIPPRGQRHEAIWEYPNQLAIREIIAETEKLACDLFDAKKADVGALSGNQIAAIMLTSLLKRGDSFLSVGGDCGGHFTTEELAKEFGYSRYDIPYNKAEGVLDVSKTAELVKETKAKLIFLDASMILFPYPVRELRQAVGEDVIISYDASHTLGMIAGKQFQNPLQEGADFLHGSTHKSLWGPQKGIILSAKSPEESEVVRHVFSRVVPLFASNVHPHHVAALGIALEESRDYGQQYAQDVVRNARILAKAMEQRGLKVVFPEKNYTDCHQLIIVIGSKDEAYAAFDRLEAVGIHINAVRVPYSDGQYGLRIGLSEITRRGIIGAQTVEVANLIADALLTLIPVNETTQNVKKISKNYLDIFYSKNNAQKVYKIQKSKIRSNMSGSN